MTSHAPDSVLIYGAGGFSGRLLAREASRVGLRPVLCGRNPANVTAVADELGLPFRIAALGTPEMAAALRNVCVVVNAAGPFAQTAQPLIDACLAAGAHYLDLSGEVRSVEAASDRHRDARAAGIMIMPAVGFDVVPSDCLALHVSRQVRDAHRLSIGVTGLSSASRGSARTLLDEIGRPVLVRRGGRLMEIPPASLRRTFDYGDGPRQSIAVSWADLVSAFYSTGIPNIDVYFEATPPLRAALETSGYVGGWLASPAARRWMGLWAKALPEGPAAPERASARAIVVAEAEGASGRRAARLTTPEVYTFTAMAAAAIAARVAGGDFEPGFQTPARLYGPDFVLTLPTVAREDLC